jgi:hypothetical protein
MRTRAVVLYFPSVNLFFQLKTAMPAAERFSFIVEWLDPVASLLRQYVLFYYSSDHTVEMVCSFAICSDQ